MAPTHACKLPTPLRAGSPYKSLLTTPQYNKAVLIHLTNPQWLNFGAPAVYRIRAMQSGDIFRWVRGCT